MPSGPIKEFQTGYITGTPRTRSIGEGQLKENFPTEWLRLCMLLRRHPSN
jgi:hypothetical protein